MKTYTTKNLVRDQLAPLQLIDRPMPEPADDEVQIRVMAIGVNRADYFIRIGRYSLDESDKDNYGIEMAGFVTKVGANVTKWKVGDSVCALTTRSSAYAEYTVAPASLLMKVPDGMSFAEAASLPVGLVTGWYNIFKSGSLKSGQKLLVHGGASGMGVLAIQMAKAMGAEVFATAGGVEHCFLCRDLGATAIDYKIGEDFVTLGPYNVIYDILGGGEYFRRNIEALYVGGSLRVLSFLGGNKTPNGIRLNKLHKPGGQFAVSKQAILDALDDEFNGDGVDLFDLAKRLNIRATDHIYIGGNSIRRLDLDTKAEIVAAINQKIMPLVIDGKIKPVIAAEVPFKEAERAHQLIVGSHTGKIVLTVPNNLVR